MKIVIHNTGLILLLMMLLTSCPPPPPPPVLAWEYTLTPPDSPSIPKNIASAGCAESPTTLRALSLKVLQEQLAAGNSDPLLLQLGGLKSLYGVIFDDPNQDILLLGSSAGNSPVLLSEDLALAVRNSWLSSSYPACSIDPPPELNTQLDDLMAQYAADQISREELYTQWSDICQTTPQAVTIDGIDFDTNFGWVLVHADYDMKNIVNGNDVPAVPGLSSLMDMQVAAAEEELLQTGTVSESGFYNRFWFTPGVNGYIESGQTVLIQDCAVLLLTESLQQEQPETDPLSIQFTQDFNALFDVVAAQRPLYRELENLYRLYALSQTIYNKLDTSDILDYLLYTMPITGRAVETTLPGCSAIREIKDSASIIVMPTCGGAELTIDPAFQAASGPSVDYLEDTVLLNRIEGVLTWDNKVNSGPEVTGTFNVDMDNPDQVDAVVAYCSSLLAAKIIILNFFNLKGHSYSDAESIANSIEIGLGREVEIVMNLYDGAGVDMTELLTNRGVTQWAAYEPRQSGNIWETHMEVSVSGSNEKLCISLRASQLTYLQEFLGNLNTNLNLTAERHWTVDRLLSHAFRSLEAQAAVDMQTAISYGQFRTARNKNR